MSGATIAINKTCISHFWKGKRWQVEASNFFSWLLRFTSSSNLRNVERVCATERSTEIEHRNGSGIANHISKCVWGHWWVVYRCGHLGWGFAGVVGWQSLLRFIWFIMAKNDRKSWKNQNHDEDFHDFFIYWRWPCCH